MQITFKPILLTLGLIVSTPFITACGNSEANAPSNNTAIPEQQTTQGAYKLVSVAEATQLLAAHPDMVVLDVRSPEEYAQGHIAGSVLMDYNAADFATQISILDPNTAYLVHCKSGHRSGLAVKMMKKASFSALYDLDGGFLAWQAAGQPVSME